MYVLQDNSFKPIQRLSSWQGREDALRRARIVSILHGYIPAVMLIFTRLSMLQCQRASSREHFHDSASKLWSYQRSRLYLNVSVAVSGRGPEQTILTSRRHISSQTTEGRIAFHNKCALVCRFDGARATGSRRDSATVIAVGSRGAGTVEHVLDCSPP